MTSDGAQTAVGLLGADDAASISQGLLPDPFAVLGPRQGTDGEYLVAYVPGAIRVWAVNDDSMSPLDPHPTNPEVWVGPTVPFYRLRAEYADAATHEWLDPYAFGPVLGELDEHLLGEGRHHRLWDALGAHLITHQGVAGVHFAVWAPNALTVSVVGDFNYWNKAAHPMRPRGATGVWELFVPGLTEGTVYKYAPRASDGRELPLKADPVGFGSQHPPLTGSMVRPLGRHEWGDDQWLWNRQSRQSHDVPISIYEVHLGSWCKADNSSRYASYQELSSWLLDYVVDMGFTHVELMPISEYPFDGSWGYQPIGLFAPTVRYGTPEEFAGFVDAAHQRGLGVICDWVPAHFPSDEHGLRRFDGTPLYEYADPREGFHMDWNTLMYNFGRREVVNYLVANALYWFSEYHVDGLRIDAVASMLNRNYSRKDGEWIPNRFGGVENLEAIDMLRELNTAVYGQDSAVMTVAEDSTSFPQVTGPVHSGGLGFGFKWNIGWMNDTLEYFTKDPIHRKYHHDLLTFGLSYGFSENFVLPISHDEVVHGKASMIGKMPGTDEEKFATLRAFYAHMWTHPGKKLLFMGQEFAQWREWSEARELDWWLLEHDRHQQIQSVVRDLNRLYTSTRALHVRDCRADGFEWIVVDDREASVFAWARYGEPGDPPVVVASNFTPVERPDYKLGYPAAGRWREIFNTDAAIYGGHDRGNRGAVTTEPIAARHFQQSALVTLPPLSTVVFIFDE
jgi:1,4-alpha-glucan branching enzyme